MKPMSKKEIQEAMKEEAIKRLAIMEKQGQHPNVKKEYPHLYYTLRTPLGGILYWLDNEDMLVKKAEEFEKKNPNCLPYFFTTEKIDGMNCLSMFYIFYNPEKSLEENMEAFKAEREDMKNNKMVMAYVENMDESLFSEFGYIAYEILGGGAIRIS